MFLLDKWSHLFPIEKAKQTRPQPLPRTGPNYVALTRPVRSHSAEMEVKNDRDFFRLSRRNDKLRKNLNIEKTLTRYLEERMNAMEERVADKEMADFEEIKQLKIALKTAQQEIKIRDEKLSIYEKFQSLSGIQSRTESIEKTVQATHDAVRSLKDSTTQVAGLRMKSKHQLKDLQASEEAKARLEEEIETQQLLRNQLATVTSQLTTSRDELSACKDDLFRLQPAVQVTDTEIMRDLDSLCKRITDWIDGEISRFEANNSNLGSGIFSLMDNWSVAGRLLREFPEAGAYLAGYLIHHNLINELFTRDLLLFGLPKETSEYLWSAEEVMATGKAPKGRNAALLGRYSS